MPIDWFNEDDVFFNHDGAPAEESSAQPDGEPGVDW
jgi:hypothetical protein